jgi:8-oxo-dGTP pyrophosphatase MutT (NUDIX family)
VALRADAVTAQRIEQLKTVLHERVRREIAVAPPLARAGVLIPLFLGDEGPGLLFTRRTDTVLTHKGQISFPGGQHEASDSTLVETALRESYEEIGLEAGRVEVLGELDDVFTSVSGFVITPVVGIVEGAAINLRLAPDEVRSVFLVPLTTLMDPAIHRDETRVFEGERYRIHYYSVGEDVIWGATGRIVYQFLKAWQQAQPPG